MMPDKNAGQWDTELIKLAETVLNEEATHEQLQQLEQLLSQDSAARSMYLDYIDIHAGLRKRFLIPVSDEDTSWEVFQDQENATQLVEQTSSKWSASSTYALLAVAACLLIAISVQFFQQEPSTTAQATQDTLLSQDSQASVRGVAVLSKVVDVVWSEEYFQYSEGTPLPAGKVVLDEGVLQIDFYSGAIAVVEGPAELNLISAESAELVSGKLHARVPVRAHGFTIKTQNGDVVDLGTEFAIDIPATASAGQLHVLDGAVRFHPSRSEEDQPQVLETGDALWLDDSSESDNPPLLDQNHFIGPIEFESLAREQEKTKRKAWREYRKQLLGDPDLVALYGHCYQPGWDRLLRNYARNAEDDTHGAIVGCEWVEGRWPGSKALNIAARVIEFRLVCRGLMTL